MLATGAKRGALSTMMSCDNDTGSSPAARVRRPLGISVPTALCSAATEEVSRAVAAIIKLTYTQKDS